MSKIISTRKYYKGTRLSRKSPESMDELVLQFIRTLKHNNQMNRQRIFAIWNEISGASNYTLDKYMKDRVLYCAISSSMVRSQLYLKREELLRKMNDALRKDRYFVSDLINDNNASLNNSSMINDDTEDYIKSIILK